MGINRDPQGRPDRSERDQCNECRAIASIAGSSVVHLPGCSLYGK